MGQIKKKAKKTTFDQNELKSNQAHLGPPEDSSRRLLLLEEATFLAWASWAASFSPILL